MRFLPLLSLAFVLHVSAKADENEIRSPRPALFDCQAFLEREPKAVLAAFLAGEPTFANNVRKHSLDEQSLGELELVEDPSVQTLNELERAHAMEEGVFKEADAIRPTALDRALRPIFKTRLGAELLSWRLANPMLDAGEIRSVQEAIKEISENVLLRESFEKPIEQLYIFEKRLRPWEQKLAALIGKIPGFKGFYWPHRNVKKELQYFGQNPAGEKMLFIRGGIMPWLLTFSLIPGDYLSWLPVLPVAMAKMVGFLGITPVLATSAEMRRSLVTQKVLAQNSMAMLPILQQAQSSYLRQLGDVLAMALDDSGPLDIAKTQRFLNRVTTNPILSIPLRLIPPLTAVMYHKRNKVKEAVHRMVVIYSVLAEADYLLGFAKLKHSDMNLRFPTILDPDPRADLLEIQEGSLPFMYFGRQQHPHYLRTTPVTNNARISTADDRPGHLLFITGPNGRGKTTYLRMIAQLAIMAQNGLPVPVEFMKLQPMKIYSSMKNTDSTVDGESLFRAEVRRVSEIVRTAREPSKEARLYLFDEVFTGTSYEEKTAAEEAIYKYLVEHRTAAIVTSHNRNLVRLGEEIPGFVNLHASEDPAQAFRILPGPSRTRNALDVMREEGIPAEIIKDAEGILSQLLK
jgi:hypothetical protein